MTLLVIGTNHKYSPIDFRESIAFSTKRLKEALVFLKAEKVLNGAVVLSTCNRVEIYASAVDAEGGIRKIIDFLSRYHEISSERLLPYLYIYRGKEALSHLFSVTCGLDSLVLGETQILGQVKCCFQESSCAGFIDEFLKKVFNSSISFARKVHLETKISEGKISIGSVTIDFIKERFEGDLSDKKILIIGVGKVTTLVLKCLNKVAPGVVFISNRSFDKAKDLAAQIGGVAVRFNELKQFIEKADVVITATKSPHFVIKREMLEQCRYHKLLIMDLAVPRDVEPLVSELNGVDLFGLEDLDLIIKKNVGKRKIEGELVKEILDVEVEKVWKCVIELVQEPALLP